MLLSTPLLYIGLGACTARHIQKPPLPNLELEHDGAKKHNSTSVGIYPDILKPRHQGWGSDSSVVARNIRESPSCGAGWGSCPRGECCNAAGICSHFKVFCEAPGCQIEYSNENCDASQRPKGNSTIDILRQQAGGEVPPYYMYAFNCTRPGLVAITYEDGPFIYTEKILDLLDEHKVKATFFITGNNIGKKPIDDPTTEWPRIIRRMHSAGHQVGSHGYSHLDLSSTTKELREQDIIYNEMAFRNILGFFPRYIRPPYDSCTWPSGCMDCLAKMGYHVIGGNVELGDSWNDTPDTVQQSKDVFNRGVSIDQTEGNYILTMHDTSYQTAYNLTEFVLQQLRQRAYKLVTIGECVGDTGDNWYIYP